MINEAEQRQIISLIQHRDFDNAAKLIPEQDKNMIRSVLHQVLPASDLTFIYTMLFPCVEHIYNHQAFDASEVRYYTNILCNLACYTPWIRVLLSYLDIQQNSVIKEMKPVE